MAKLVLILSKKTTGEPIVFVGLTGPSNTLEDGAGNFLELDPNIPVERHIKTLASIRDELPKEIRFDNKLEEI